MLRSFEGHEPDIHEDAYVDPSSVVIGDVTIGADASVWPNVTLRGDHGPITVAEGANVQDNAVLHEGAEIGPYATVGHTAIVHAAEVRSRALVGMGATVLDRSVLGERAMVGANSVVTEDTEIEADTLYAGVPVEFIKEVEDSPWASAGDRYVELSRRHAEGSERIEGAERPSRSDRPERGGADRPE
ncbi:MULTISPECIES: gamma carbonic anhydrase family protein [Halobacteriales]|uniref:PaaY family protein n=2 Tax=Halobacteriales TaxID=2235 RepID=M1Y443_NATM8|nr:MULTISPECIES: gamma carbonic anhydrase family protein [Halobacteria]RJX47104.1 gamma carbonic anhydrase family protein [Halonotius pteroides]CCQ37299.1 PaaY family protein [Natronomonas moolapensis 8.8.11]